MPWVQVPLEAGRSLSVAVSTLVFETRIPSSNLGGTAFCTRHNFKRLESMSRTPFTGDDVRAVPDDLITGHVLMRLDAEFKRTRTCPTGIDFLLDDWKSGQIRMAGVFETQEVFDHARNNYPWHLKTFVKPGAPWSIFYAVVILRADGSPDVGWISPAVDRVRARWIKAALDPEESATWSGGT